MPPKDIDQTLAKVLPKFQAPRQIFPVADITATGLKPKRKDFEEPATRKSKLEEVFSFD